MENQHAGKNYDCNLLLPMLYVFIYVLTNISDINTLRDTLACRIKGSINKAAKSVICIEGITVFGVIFLQNVSYHAKVRF